MVIYGSKHNPGNTPQPVDNGDILLWIMWINVLITTKYPGGSVDNKKDPQQP